MVLASCRMKRWAREWGVQKKVKASLVRGLENLKEEQRVKGRGNGKVKGRGSRGSGGEGWEMV